MELNLAIVTVEDSVATVNDSLTIGLASLEETAAVLDGRIGRLELSGKFNLNQEIRHKIDL